MRKYRAVYRCVKCDTKLSKEDHRHSDGVCPYCGQMSDSSLVKVKKLIEAYDEAEQKSKYSNFVWAAIVAFITFAIGVITGLLA